MNSSESAQIKGESIQYLEIELEPDCEIKADTGSMVYCEDGIPIRASTPGGLFGGLKRTIGGGASFFLQTLKNESQGRRRIVLASSHPGQIKQISLDDLKGEIVLRGNAFLAGIGDFDFNTYRVKGIGGFLGADMLMQRLTGTGKIWIQATGSMLEVNLDRGGHITANAGSLLGFETAVSYEVTYQGVSALFAGQRLFLGQLSGRGKVWLQSSSPFQLARALQPYLTTEEDRKLGFSLGAS